MDKINDCVTGNQHFWVTLPKGEGLQCYSCPMCSQLVYWSDINLSWIKPSTSGGKPIIGNQSETDQRAHLFMKKAELAQHFDIDIEATRNNRKLLRNAVHPEIGAHILKAAMKETKQGVLL